MEIEVDGIVLIYDVGRHRCYIEDKNTGQSLNFRVEKNLTEAEAYHKIEDARIFFAEEERNKKYYWQEYGRN